MKASKSALETDIKKRSSKGDPSTNGGVSGLHVKLEGVPKGKHKVFFTFVDCLYRLNVWGGFGLRWKPSQVKNLPHYLEILPQDRLSCTATSNRYLPSEEVGVQNANAVLPWEALAMLNNNR